MFYTLPQLHLHKLHATQSNIPDSAPSDMILDNLLCYAGVESLLNMSPARSPYYLLFYIPLTAEHIFFLANYNKMQSNNGFVSSSI